ncbi:hypothetical protein [Catellatospora chokoriensis]|uniref:hypothetical protein n=1 Tax=Catellatospora chokoriensis TaxID=310353 RepID=UPI00177C5298|nr:hypothetical protein [Catellatospora chokoriensis]
MNWDFAESVLSAVLPGSTAFDPNGIVGIPLDAWESFDIEQRDADVIEDEFLSRCVGLKGPLIVVNSTSFDADQGPFFVEASQLHQFVKTFHVRVRDYFMYASVIVVSPLTGIVIIVQDDGYIVTVQGRSIMAPSCDMGGA